jgi:hypothetical protein
MSKVIIDRTLSHNQVSKVWVSNHLIPMVDSLIRQLIKSVTHTNN